MENQRSSVNILPPTSCGSRLSYCSESGEAEVGQGTSLDYLSIIMVQIIFSGSFGSLSSFIVILNVEFCLSQC